MAQTENVVEAFVVILHCREIGIPQPSVSVCDIEAFEIARTSVKERGKESASVAIRCQLGLWRGATQIVRQRVFPTDPCADTCVA